MFGKNKKEFTRMATNKTKPKKKNAGRSWKNERASVKKTNTSRSKSNKYSTSDKSKRVPVARSARWVKSD